MAWLSAHPSIDDQDVRIREAMECSRLQEREAEHLSCEVHLALKEFRRQLEVDDRTEPWP